MGIKYSFVWGNELDDLYLFFTNCPRMGNVWFLEGCAQGQLDFSLLDFLWKCLLPVLQTAFSPQWLAAWALEIHCAVNRFVLCLQTIHLKMTSPSPPTSITSHAEETQDAQASIELCLLPGDVWLCSVSLSEVYGLKGNWFAMVFKTRAGGYCCALLQYSSLEKTIAKAKTLTSFVMWFLLMHSAGVRFALFLQSSLLFLQE